MRLRTQKRWVDFQAIFRGENRCRFWGEFWCEWWSIYVAWKNILKFTRKLPKVHSKLTLKDDRDDIYMA